MSHHTRSDIEPEIDEEIKHLVVEGTKSIASGVIIGDVNNEASLLSPCPIYHSHQLLIIFSLMKSLRP
jgi:hypothetical protein